LASPFRPLAELSLSGLVGKGFWDDVSAFMGSSLGV
jgi:hypothetical protein